MMFRYYRDFGAGWRFAPGGGTPVGIQQEFTSGVLRLSGFARQLTVVGHLERDGCYFVVYKPGREDEIRGKQLTRSEYERYGFDPYAVAAEVFGLEVSEAMARADEGGPWPAKTDDYLPEAMGLFRGLSVAKRRHPYLSALPGHGASSGAFPHTRFRQISDPVGDSAFRGKEAGQADVSGETLGELSGVVRRHGDEMRTLRRELKRLREDIESARQDEGRGVGPVVAKVGRDGGNVRTQEDGRLSREISRWAPAGVAVVALVASGVFAIEAARRASAAEAAARAAEQRAGTAVEAAGAAGVAANTEAAVANEANARAGAAEHNAEAAARSARNARDSADDAIENFANATRVALDSAQDAAQRAEQRAEAAEKQAEAAENEVLALKHRVAAAEALAVAADEKAADSAAAAESAETIAKSAKEAAEGAAASVAALTEKAAAAAESDDGAPGEAGDTGSPQGHPGNEVSAMSPSF